MPPLQPIEIERHADSKKLYIFFGGLAAGIAMPPFEFYNAAKILSENKIYIRDLRQCWYHAGLPGVSTDIPTTADFLARQIEEIAPESIFFVGNSMGGFAAFLFSNWLECGQVISFAPQTFISPMLRAKHNDHRWPRQIQNTYKQAANLQKVYDLKPFLQKRVSNRRMLLFVSETHELDHLHAMHLQGIDNLTVFSSKGRGHGIVRDLRDEGKLPLILSGEFAETM